MKKVGILTFPNSPSFGASLQMVALYKVVESLGLDVEVINYTNRYMKERKHMLSHKESAIRFLINNVLTAKGIISFKRFEKRVKKYPSKIISTRLDLEKVESRYDYLIVGSDQVWNPRITGLDFGYLFDFCAHNEKKIAYAPSFGVTELTEEQSDAYRTQLQKFHAISVREDSGCDIIENLIGRRCPVVVDPTFLLSKREWEKQSVRTSFGKSKYIVKFIFNYDGEVEDFIRDLSNKTNLPVLEVGGNLFSNIKHRGRWFTGAIGPAEWLDVIRNAEYVVTDSFHGAAFSIIFEKNVYVSLASATNSRLITLLESAGLSDRVIKDREFAFEGDIKYDIVSATLSEKRNKSLEYLRESLR